MPGKGDTLTGGTKDVNPQLYRLTVATIAPAGAPFTSAAPVPSVTATFPLPINRLQQKAGKAIVVEILQARWDPIITSVFEPGMPAQQAFVTSTLSTAPQDNALSALATTIDYIDAVRFIQPSQELAIGLPPVPFALPMVISGYNNFTHPVYHDLTDGAGHGVLVATDNIYLNISAGLTDLDVAGFTSNVPKSSAFSAQCDLLYRFKEVTLQEYIGIVQSQQNPARS